MSSVSGALSRSYSYDNAGNTTSDGTATFTYNDAGRMVSATKASVTTTYALNALGQRVKKTTSGSSTYLVYDEAGHLIGEYDNSGNLVQETVWFGDTPVATLKPNGGGVDHFYVHTDHLNTPRRISRPSDNVVVWRWDSDPFGTTAASEDPDGDSNVFAFNLRFPGQYLDAETGLHYNYFRDYDPATGRYAQSDPIGLWGGRNTYAYALSQPLRYFDTLGLAPPGTCGPVDTTLTCKVKQAVYDGRVEDLLDMLDLNPSDNADDLIKQCMKNREKWVKKFKKEFRTNDEFKDWFHRDYKPDVKATSRDRLNPDLTEQDLADAYLEWLETFGGG